MIDSEAKIALEVGLQMLGFILAMIAGFFVVSLAGLGAFVGFVRLVTYFGWI